MDEIERLLVRSLKLEEEIAYWSYCTYQGMKATCPEKESEFIKFMTELNIRLYSEKG